MSRSDKKRLVRNAQRAYAVALKGGRCETCNRKYLPEVYDFHAPDGHVDKKVGDLYGSSLKRVVAEVKVCDLLCPTCHRIVHVEEREDG